MKRWILGATLAGTVATGGTFAADQAINPYEDKGTHYELPIVSDIPQGERVEVAKDKAEVTLLGWNDEYAITITPQVPTAEGVFGAEKREFDTPAERPLLSKRLEFRQGDVTAFVEPKEGTQNEFDVDFTLESKPDTNVFTYKIEGADEFDFFYQPELTAEEIAEGTDRPENVIGSYAVYHKTKANHRVGSTNYATGKAFHIFRPKAVDANGAETWAELTYSDGVLVVTVPEKFLDEADYPVTIDPTLGFTGIGGTNATVNANIVLGSLGATTDGGTPTSISFYGHDTEATADVKGAIWTASTLALLANSVTDEFTNLPAVAAWNNLSFSVAPSLAANTHYYVGWLSNENTNRYFDTAEGQGILDVNAYATPVNLDALPSQGVDSKHSVYVTLPACSPGVRCTEVFSGTATWTAPSGVTTADVACWGGGGGGFDDNTSANGGAGGGGGAFASSTVAVTPGNNYTVTVGAGATENGNGTDSTFTGDDKTVTADAGTGATSATANGTGGTEANSTGDVENAGGDGADALTTDDTGGGGGAAAGPHGDGGAGAAGQASTGGGGGGGNGGTAGSGQTGGSSTNGGAGGNGGSGTAGSNASYHIYGGGGGGGGDNGTAGGWGGIPGGGGGGAEGNGGRGAAGQCIITYTITAAAAAPTDTGIIWFD